jgi:hypothetical protein
MDMLVIPNQGFSLNAIDAVAVLSPLWGASYARPIVSVLTQTPDCHRSPLKHRTPEFWES